MMQTGTQPIQGQIPTSTRLSPKAYIRSRCREIGANYDDVMSKCRAGNVAAQRRRIIAEVHDAFPRMSAPALGMLFGRDPKTIHFLIGRSGRRYRPARASDHIETIRRMFRDGHSFAAIGRRIGYSADAVSQIIKRQGW